MKMSQPKRFMPFVKEAITRAPRIDPDKKNSRKDYSLYTCLSFLDDVDGSIFEKKEISVEKTDRKG
jgi:hypothetical protein